MRKAPDRAWLRDFPGVSDWRKILPVRDGWSSDEKYEIYTYHGEHLLLRVADACKMNEKYTEFAFVQRCQALGFPMPHPISCGLHAGRVYQLLSWVEGEPVASALVGMPESEQYRLGQEAGRALAAIHSVVLEPNEWTQADHDVEQRKQVLFQYLSSPNRMAGDESVVMFVAKHIVLPKRLAGLHGDFHIGNLVMGAQGKLGVIDFNRRHVGDRWEDFQKAQAFSVPRSTAFVNGQIHAYFCGQPPDEFWEAFAYETAFGAIEQIVSAQNSDADVVRQMQLNYARAMRDFRGFTLCEPPRWYLSVNQMSQRI